jgi:23S rRNA G2069 N7-methylase RlmK/C1962 C5-methylase RlmI
VLGAYRPEDVATFVTYLVSDEADNVNGCIFEVFKNRVAIFTEPQPLEQVLWKEGPWTPEELAKVMPETLTRGREREKYPKTLPYVFD